MLVEEVAKLPPRERFLYWMRERHQVYLKKRAGKPKPWTNDWILQRFFFTNPFRENDKVTAWFREQVRDPLKDQAEVLMATVAFRWFTKIETGRLLMGLDMDTWHPSWPRTNLLTNWDTEAAVQRLLAYQNQGNTVFTGAFVISGAGTGGKKITKVEAVCRNYIDPIHKQEKELLDELKRGAYERKSTMQSVHELLSEFPGFGGTGFMAYEVVCDLRWTWVLEHAPDKCTWSNPGPGARRGLNRVLGRDLDARVTPAEWTAQSRELLAVAARRLRGMPPLEMREIEHSLCEWDKYERARIGDGHMKRRYPGAADPQSTFW